jgi:hypothetical protein
MQSAQRSFGTALPAGLQARRSGTRPEALLCAASAAWELAVPEACWKREGLDDGQILSRDTVAWPPPSLLPHGAQAFAAAASMESVWTRAYGHPTSLSEQYINDW